MGEEEAITDANGSAPVQLAPVRRLYELDPNDANAATQAAQLHLELLGHGPMARLGQRFLSRFCYSVLIRDGLLRAALYEINGQLAGFVAYTERSITFHRTAIRSHWLYVAYVMMISVLRDPRLFFSLVKAVRVMFARRSETCLGTDPLAEIVAIGVRPEFRTPGFIRATGLRIAEELVAHAAAWFRRLDLKQMRMIVEAHNRPALLFYHRLGAQFAPYEQAGEPMVQVWLNL
jgi:ribosomal protein S18 acetylase RimI-like enzyme